MHNITTRNISPAVFIFPNFQKLLLQCRCKRITTKRRIRTKEVNKKNILPCSSRRPDMVDICLQSSHASTSTVSRQRCKACASLNNRSNPETSLPPPIYFVDRHAVQLVDFNAVEIDVFVSHGCSQILDVRDMASYGKNVAAIIDGSIHFVVAI